MTGKQLDLVETRDPAEPFVLFGVRACDARSFAILDRVFLSEPQDTYYAARRAHGTVVTLACTRPEETCFCQAFGVDPVQPQGDTAGQIPRPLYQYAVRFHRSFRLSFPSRLSSPCCASGVPAL